MAVGESDQLNWLVDMRDHARRQLELIDQGWHFQISIGSQRREDITAEVAERARATVERLSWMIDGAETDGR